MERPTIRQLEYVVALARHLNFRRAAEACYVTQPGLSAQIRQLEDALGVQLFERDRRRVLVTPAGEAVIAAARRVLAEVDALVDAARGSSDPLTGTVHLGVIPTIAPYLLPAALSRVRERYPDARVLLREERTAELVALAESGELDVLLVALEADLGHLETVELFVEPFVVAVPEGHRLARRRRLRLADLDAEEVLLLDDGHCLRDQLVPLCQAAGAGELADCRASSLGTLVRMVANGIGITLLPAMAVVSEVRPQDSVTVVPLASPQPSRTIGLAWRHTAPGNEAYRRLGRLIVDCMPRTARKSK